MKASNMIRWAVTCGVAMSSAVLGASDIAAGQWERQTIDDGTPSMGIGEGLYLCEKAASVSYAGTGTWTLPLGNVFAFGNTEIGVRNGTLRFENSAPLDLVANPPVELQRAALWLDAEKNTQTEVIDGMTCVLAWFDARESSAAASNYGYAAASDTTGAGPVLVSNYVSFRGYDKSSARRSFLYRATDGTAVAYNIRHAFFVQRVNNVTRTAPVLGNSSEGCFFPGATWPYAILSPQGNANPLAYSCEYLLDGINGDATAGMAVGTHLHEFTLPPNRTIGVDSLMQDRNVASGGHGIHEILLFTQPLTMLERMRITAYLKTKWSCGASENFAIDTAKGATVELADGVSLDSVAVTGEGVASVGSGVNASAAHLYSDGSYSHAPYSLKDSTSSLDLQAAEYEYRLSSRESLTVAATTKQLTLTKASSAPNGNVAVTSARNFIVSNLAPAITNLAFSGGGDLVLRATSSHSSGYVPGTASAAIFAATSLSVPTGRAGAETTVEVPVAGDWEVAFDIANAFDGGDGGVALYVIQLKRGDSIVWERRPTSVDPSAYGNANQVRRYRLRNLAAGTYTFRASGVADTALAAAISGLSMTLVPNPARETVVPVTDGDFESSRFKTVFNAARSNNSGGRTGWSLTNAELTEDPPVQAIVTSAMGCSGKYDFMFRSSQLGRYGDNALLWYHNNSTATSPATVFPAGTTGLYKLRLEAVRWMTGTNEHANVGTNPSEKNANAKRCNGEATITASAMVNGGDPISLGSIGPIANFTTESLSFPNSLTVFEGDSVTVVLHQDTGWAAVQLDNLEFVKVGEGASSMLGTELVEDGSCAAVTSAAWHFDDWTDGFRRLAEIISPISNSYGSTGCDGDNVIRSAQGGRAYQTIAFPAGVFRLSWWSRARVDQGTIPERRRTKTTFWYATDGAATTNEIVTSEMSWCTNFLEHVAYFRVSTAGIYVFGFNSEEKSGVDVLVDCVSVRQVLGPEVTPNIPVHTKIVVSGGGKLRLDYNGCLRLAKVRVNGKSLTGEISAAKFPDLVSGPGKVFVSPCFAISFR